MNSKDMLYMKFGIIGGGKKMKTIKNGLITTAFAGLTGCGMTLQELRDSDRPSEKINIDLDVGYDECPSADVIFDPHGYRINCDYQHSFRFYSYPNLGKRGELLWGNVTYNDSDGDGHLTIGEDYLLVDGEVVAPTADLDSKYHSLLRELNQPQVRSVWEERWR